MKTLPTTTTSVLGSGEFETDGISLRSALFEVLLGIADRHVKHYRSDLYHDAMALGLLVAGPTTLQYAVNATGTWLCLADSDMAQDFAQDRRNVYLIELLKERSLWVANVTKKEA